MAISSNFSSEQLRKFQQLQQETIREQQQQQQRRELEQRNSIQSQRSDVLHDELSHNQQWGSDLKLTLRAKGTSDNQTLGQVRERRFSLANQELHQAVDQFAHLSPELQQELGQQIQDRTLRQLAGKQLSQAETAEIQWQTAAKVANEWSDGKLSEYAKGGQLAGGFESAQNLVQLQHYARLFESDRELYLRAGGEQGRIDLQA